MKTKCGGVSFLASPGAKKADDLTASVREFVARRAEIANDDVYRRLLSARLAIGWANALDPKEHNDARRALAEVAFGEFRQLGDQIPFDHAEAAAVLGECARMDGATDEAQRYAGEAWRAAEGGRPPGDWFEASQQVRIARILSREGMYQPAKELLLPAYKVLHDQLGDSHPDAQVTIALIENM